MSPEEKTNWIMGLMQSRAKQEIEALIKENIELKAAQTTLPSREEFISWVNTQREKRIGPSMGDAYDWLRDNTKPKERALGFEIKVDPGMPEDEVHFRDKSGETVGKIVNIKRPEANIKVNNKPAIGSNNIHYERPEVSEPFRTRAIHALVDWDGFTSLEQHDKDRLIHLVALKLEANDY